MVVRQGSALADPIPRALKQSILLWSSDGSTLNISLSSPLSAVSQISAPPFFGMPLVAISPLRPHPSISSYASSSHTFFILCTPRNLLSSSSSWSIKLRAQANESIVCLSLENFQHLQEVRGSIYILFFHAGQNEQKMSRCPYSCRLKLSHLAAGNSQHPREQNVFRERNTSNANERLSNTSLISFGFGR